jgi:N6-L-threonylcarbamoyladenine synthase
MRLFFPPPSLCTDNAAMIAWTGIEMYEAGFTNDYSIRAIRKWPMEKLVDDLPSDA